MTASASPASPQDVGTAVTWTASASGGSGAYQDEFRVWDPYGFWSLVQAYGASNTWTRNTTRPAGTYNVEVLARIAGSTAPWDVFQVVTSLLQGGTDPNPGVADIRCEFLAPSTRPDPSPRYAGILDLLPDSGHS